MREQSFIRLVERLRDRDPGLFPTGVWDEGLDLEIADLVTSEFVVNRSSFDLTYGLAVKAGLHFWNESLKRSHVLSQDVHNSTGSLWHGIMHRMGRIGKHPVLERLQTVKNALLHNGDWEMVSSQELHGNLRQFHLQRAWDPHLFIELVQGTVTSGHEFRLEKLLTALQKQEIIMLLEFSYRNASGGQILESFNR